MTTSVQHRIGCLPAIYPDACECEAALALLHHAEEAIATLRGWERRPGGWWPALHIDLQWNIDREQPSSECPHVPPFASDATLMAILLEELPRPELSRDATRPDDVRWECEADWQVDAGFGAGHHAPEAVANAWLDWARRHLAGCASCDTCARWARDL